MWHPSIDSAAEQFMKYDYAETKDLCKQFLTLVSGILVFSITFAEKIVGYKEEGISARWPIVASWASFIVAISLVGIALGLIARAGGSAVNGGPEEFYRNLENLAALFSILGGLSFIVGLLCLVIAGMKTLARRT